MYKKSGIARLPLLLGMAVLAVLLPATVNLVQHQQDSRRHAASSQALYPHGQVLTQQGQGVSGSRVTVQRLVDGQTKTSPAKGYNNSKYWLVGFTNLCGQMNISAQVIDHQVLGFQYQGQFFPGQTFGFDSCTSSEINIIVSSGINLPTSTPIALFTPGVTFSPEPTYSPYVTYGPTQIIQPTLIPHASPTSINQPTSPYTPSPTPTGNLQPTSIQPSFGPSPTPSDTPPLSPTNIPGQPTSIPIQPTDRPPWFSPTPTTPPPCNVSVSGQVAPGNTVQLNCQFAGNASSFQYTLLLNNNPPLIIPGCTGPTCSYTIPQNQYGCYTFKCIPIL